MSFAAHGNWCGPGWSAHQWKDAKDLTEEDKLVPAIDALDQACKNHDIRIAEGDPEANEKFAEEAGQLGYKGAAFAALVKWLGPSSQSILQNKKQMPRRPVKDPEEEFEAWKSSNSIRLRNKQNAERQTYREFQQHENRVYAVDAAGESSERKRKSEEDLDDTSDRSRTQDEFPVENPDDAIHATIDEEMNQNMVTPQMVPRNRDPTMSREDRPLRGFRPQGSLTNLLNQVDNRMADNDVEMAPMASRSAGTQTGSITTRAGNRETLVRYNARAEMGIFTETRTAYLPLTVYFSINRTQIFAPIPLHFRVDWPYDIFSRNTLVQQQLRILYNESCPREDGLSNDMAKQGLRGTVRTGTTAAANNFHLLGIGGVDPAYNQAQLIPFPTTVVGSVAAVQGTNAVNGKSSSGTIADNKAIPGYRKWYAKMYQYAHCMETDWKVTYFSGDANEEFQNIRVYEGLDCQSTGNTDTIPVDRELGAVDHWPYLKKHDIVQRTESKAKQEYVISGTWNPNQQHPLKMVANEEDIKTWTKLGTSDFVDRSPTAYREDVTLLHYSHPDSLNNAAFVNVRIDLRYKIQFKDLANILRWPSSNITPITLSSADCVQVPTPSNSVGVGANPERVYADGVIPR